MDKVLASEAIHASSNLAGNTMKTGFQARFYINFNQAGVYLAGNLFFFKR
jgi:hypothetical protein